MKKLNILTLAATAVLSFGAVGALTSCGGGDSSGTTEDTEDTDDGEVVEKITVTADMITTPDEDGAYQVGTKAKFKFKKDGVLLTDDEYNKYTQGIKATFNVENTAALGQGNGYTYISFSKPGKVTATISSKYFNKFNLSFTVKKRVEVAGKTNLIISGPAEQTDFLTEVATLYNSKITNDKDKVNFIFEDHGEDKVDSEILDWTEGPDIYAFASDKIAPLHKKSALSKLPKESVDTITTNLTDQAINAAAFPTELDYKAYPYDGGNGYYLFYNKEVITDASKLTNMKTLMDFAESKGKKVAYPLDTAFYSAGALFSYGARYEMEYDDNGNLRNVDADFNTEKGVRAGKAIYNIMKHPAYQETQQAPSGDVIACVDGTWNASAYEKKLGDKLGITKLPEVEVDGIKANLHSFLGHKLYGVNDNKGDASRTAAAHKFARFLVSDEVQTLRFTEFHTYPTSKEVLKRNDVKNDASIAAFTLQSQFTVNQTAVPANVWTAPHTLTQGIIQGKVTLANMAEQMDILNKSIKASK